MASNDLNFQLIIDNCRRGDRNSQRVLYEYYFGYGLNICLRYTPNQEEAKEMLNDAFLKIFTKLDQYDSNYPFKSWIRRIFTNAAIDHYRKGRRLIRTVALEELPEIVDTTESDPFVTPQTDVLPVIQRLPPMYRMVFNLYVMEGYKHHEIAEMLGISIGTSKSNLLRAKRKLQRQLMKRENLVKQTSQ